MKAWTAALFCCCFVRLSLAQKPQVLVADNPLLNNVRALPEPHLFLIQSLTEYQHTALIDPVPYGGFTGKYSGSINSIVSLKEQVGVRYAILKGLEAQLGYRHNLIFNNITKASGEGFTNTASQWANWVIGGRFSRYIPQSKLSIGLQVSLVGEFFPSEFYFSTSGVEANLLLGKEFNDHHQLTGGVGLNSVFQDQVPISLCYTYSPIQTFGFYTKGAYTFIFSSIGGGELHSVDFGGGAYYCISNNWRVDLAALAILGNYPHTKLKNPFQLNLGVAAGF